MKKILYLFIILTFFACGGDDEDNQTSNFETEVQNLTIESATVTWNTPTNFSGDVIYRVVLK